MLRYVSNCIGDDEGLHLQFLFLRLHFVCGFFVPPSKHVNNAVFDERAKHKHETGRHPDVYGLNVGDTGETRHDTRRLRCHGEHGQQPQGDASRDSVNVDPERHPGEYDDEDAGYERLDQVIIELPSEMQLSEPTGEGA